MNRNTNGQFMFSPADGLASVPSPGAHSNPPEPSCHPYIDMTGKSGDTASGSKGSENYAGESETVSSGGAKGVTLAEAPETPKADLGMELGGDLNSVPKPSGSY